MLAEPEVLHHFVGGGQINSELVNFDGTEPYSNDIKSEYRKGTLDVESFYQNDWGLWQMHGNVWEWCQDWYGAYPENNVIDPVGPKAGVSRVQRGGSWFVSGGGCRSAYRNRSAPFDRGNSVGFRLARSY